MDASLLHSTVNIGSSFNFWKINAIDEIGIATWECVMNQWKFIKHLSNDFSILETSWKTSRMYGTSQENNEPSITGKGQRGEEGLYITFRVYSVINLLPVVNALGTKIYWNHNIGFI